MHIQNPGPMCFLKEEPVQTSVWNQILGTRPCARKQTTAPRAPRFLQKGPLRPAPRGRRQSRAANQPNGNTPKPSLPGPGCSRVAVRAAQHTHDPGERDPPGADGCPWFPRRPRPRGPAAPTTGDVRGETGQLRGGQRRPVSLGAEHTGVDVQLSGLRGPGQKLGQSPSSTDRPSPRKRNHAVTRTPRRENLKGSCPA